MSVVLLLVLVVFLARQIGRLRRRIEGLTRGVDGQSLDHVLDAHLDKVFEVSRELDELSARSAVLEAANRQAIQNVGLVRFNAFDDAGGNQSFALALTDGRGTGFVITSLHSRTGTRVYAKGITAGRSEGAFSEEETKALAEAMPRTPGPAAAVGAGRGA